MHRWYMLATRQSNLESELPKCQSELHVWFMNHYQSAELRATLLMQARSTLIPSALNSRYWRKLASHIPSCVPILRPNLLEWLGKLKNQHPFVMRALLAISTLADLRIPIVLSISQMKFWCDVEPTLMQLWTNLAPLLILVSWMLVECWTLIG